MSFREAAIIFIKRRALESKRVDDLELIHFGAYLFAIGCQLALNHGNARLLVRGRPPRPRASREELLDQLAGLSEDLSPSALYWTVISALRALESLVCRRPSYRDALPASTDLTDFTAGPYRGLSGRVLHWIRPVSEFTVERERRFERARKRPPDPAPDPGIYLRALAMYWDSDPQLPEVLPVKPGPRILRLFESSLETKCFKVALCPLIGGFHPLFRIHSDGRHFQTLEENAMAGKEELHEHLNAVVDTAIGQGIHLLVLPELAVDPPARSHLRGLLRAKLKEGGGPLHGVVAGSFHLWGRVPFEGGLPVNEAVLLDPAGETSAWHWKKGRFRVPSSELKDPSQFYPDGPPAEMAKEIFEDIHYGSQLQVLDTSLGRLAVLICADAIAADDRGYLPVVRRLRPDLLIVVSMTRETQPFEAFAEDMSRYWIGTIFVNAHCICAGANPNLMSCDLALNEPGVAPPTRLRWRNGQEAECRYYKPRDDNRDWRFLRDALGETGFSWLTQEGKRLGAIIDLGIHWNLPDVDEQQESSKKALDANSGMS